MAKLQIFTPVLVSLIIILLPQLDPQFATAIRPISITDRSITPNYNKTSFGFSTELIHRFSPKSPFYRKNQTFMEQVSEYIKISEQRASMYMHTLARHKGENLTFGTTNMRPLLLPVESLYLLPMYVGTPEKPRRLTFDTGSGQTWIKCVPCDNCYHSDNPVFDPQQSSSYSKLTTDNPLCQYYQIEDSECRYSNNYGDGSTVKGTASFETFTFWTVDEPDTIISNVLFGCTHEAQGTFFSDMDGILAMDTRPISFISQLDTADLHKFSYCFPRPLPEGIERTTFLKFGADTGEIGPGFVTMPYVKHVNNYWYGLDIIDISVGDTRLNFPEGTFDARPDGTGGMVLDSGSVITFLENPIYRRVHDAMVSYFSDKGVQKLETCSPPIELCYVMPSPEYDQFPTMTLHMRAGDLRVEPQELFIVRENEEDQGDFSLAVAPLGWKSILGVMQQRNTRFIFDNKNSILAFVPEDCSNF